MTLKIRISLVDYLNAAPLGWSFIHGPLRGEFDVIPSSPAGCADQLSRGEVDLGLIPSIEYQRIPGLQVIPGIAIAAATKVRSILMVRCHATEGIKSVALDTNSRTSVALIKVLLRMKMGIHPEFVPHLPDLAAMLRICDAALLIGDAALRISLEDYQTVDLAEAWVEWQQRPFVFAFWACRTGIALPNDLVLKFQEATEWGLRARQEIAAIYSQSLHLPVSFLERYLFENIDYRMGSRHIEGLEKFYLLAQQGNLISDVRPLQLMPVR